ncbi:helicase-exonuclease AddAB subunit AddB [Neobacillus piezotolerans]|uniref:ATP-dependent helicase/deoxyribonuclease subunit B n=1 Tax=Neobacillus piezotolerans TaxID=2259171 RepID=A0A3D8GMQ6_9BACI|nr:helicase-exonuclease AddAB subunit AddB [Neobacillus piezotolerans]RDU35519.1 helicase-exonuclease AddAB subunit AddB [Neobacillus piezotolerans]
MSLRMLIGRAGSGKTLTCIDEIKSRLAESPEGPAIIYLVPEQMTFLSEYRLATDQTIGGMIRAQVYSFTRLAWRVLQETGGSSRYHLSSVGLNMLIRKIIEEQKDQLRLFKRAADKNGFIQQVEEMLMEFKRYCIDPENLAASRAKIGSEGRMDKSLSDKMHDLEIIYKHFQDTASGKYIDSEDYFRLLAEKTASSRYLKDAEVYIDGFYSFTPQEYRIIGELLKVCKSVTVTLTLDRPCPDKAPDELNLFRMSGETCKNLFDLARNERIEMEGPIILGDQRRWTNGGLRHLEGHFDSRPAKPYEGDCGITVIQAVNRRAEVEGIAREIRRLVREDGYRYRDIAILMRNGGDYHETVEPVFYDYEIPYFIDQKRTMLNHPLVELIRSSLEAVNGHWGYEAVFRAVKTELLFPPGVSTARMRRQMDKLENYVLSHGIQGKKWTGKERWRYRRIRGLDFVSTVQTNEEIRMEQELNELRLIISTPLMRLSRRLKRAGSGRKMCEAVFLLLEELDIPAKLENWKAEAEAEGNLVKGREHDQVWNAIIDLLDQYVEMLGDEPVAPRQFASILDAGLESLEFSLVPPAIDQVMVANLDKSRLAEIKVAFVLGLNEGVLPAKISDDGILGDADRDMLALAGVKIGPGSTERLLDENFIAYKAFVTPADKLYISYPLANAEGKSLIPSSYIKRMEDLFPGCDKWMIVADPADLNEEEQLSFVSSKETALAYLTSQLQLKQRNYPIYTFWWDVYNYFAENPRLRGKARTVLSSLFYTNRTVKLPSSLAAELYGEDIQGSVSRMELFNSCPFSHYIQHGLKLRDRQIYKLDAPDIGELFHAALKYIAETVNEQNISWADLSKVQCENLAKSAVAAIAPRLQNEILLSSQRHHYIKRKLEQIITRASVVLSEHSKLSEFEPVGLEVGFGRGGKLPPLEFNLKNGSRMELTGRIDRIDRGEGKNGEYYLRVIDYKSSSRGLNLSEVYYGIALQVLTYLDIAISNSALLVEKVAEPAGVFYFHVHNPMVNTTRRLSEEEIEKEILKKFKMSGLVLEDEEVIRLMDKSLESGDSQIISAGFKKDGTLTKASKTATAEDIEDLRKFVRKVYSDTGNAIISGEVGIDPYRLKDKSPCTFCSFKPVCQFDESIDGSKYRRLVPQNDEEALELIRREVREDE